MIREVHDAGVGRGVDVVAALLDEPQVKREPELVALDVNKTVARQRAVQLHKVPQVGSRHDGVRFLLQQIVDALAQSAHILYEVAALEVLLTVLHRHDSHRVATQRHGTIDRRNGTSRLRASRRHDALHVVAALHLRRFGWHGARRNTGHGCLAHHDGVLRRCRFEKITEKTHILFLFTIRAFCGFGFTSGFHLFRC